jgi:tetratricopeptide (TPR) repeat protein
MYENGNGVPQSFEKAAEWRQKAAEQGEAGAQNDLGVMYEYGQGVPQSFEKAAEWYQKAAEQGVADAQFNLGRLYYSGQGVSQSVEKAVEWFQKAAEQGDATAQFNLGVIDENRQSFEKAAEWYRKAAEQGHEQAPERLTEVQKRLTEVQKPSGKAKNDSTDKAQSQEFAKKYPTAASEYQNAVKLLEMGMVTGSLSSARVSLEYTVKEFCKQCGLDTSDTNPEITLMDMINALGESNVVSEKEVSTLHRTRIICNRGAHAGEVPPELEDAQEAENTFSLLMGDQPELRRKFIEENSKLVENLDV